MSRRTRLSRRKVVHYLDEDLPSCSELGSDADDSDKDQHFENEFILDSSDSDCYLDDSNNQNDIVLPVASLGTSIISSLT